MKLIVLLGSGLLMASPVSATLPQVVVKQNEGSKTNNNENGYLDKITKIMSNEINEKNQKQIKQIFLNSIVKENDLLKIDSNKIKQMQNLKLEKIFSSKEFSSILNELYASKSIVYQNNQFEFKNQKLLTTTRGLWIETYWYWFGYCKLHLDNQLTTDLADAFKEVYDPLGSIGAVLYIIPEFTTLAPTMGPALFVYGGTGYINSVNSLHKGIWFGTYGFLSFGWAGPWTEQ
ncbi:hypothetical protein ELUMI_v1c01100 [Williamsoniiplasma luminosum]|uniref:Uncharacterized protein n=1 Tax=Williamsoniiplasma luminosum TaxID=214888 RepID=A0A2K8NUJ6_9MOLU|nr:hypothetical protein [Williamsoniiplasma luminosum]ATZ16838.1 hypothetical protein ELUMI_v1c01100 [Williamsoniiplasma luminosum]